ncbi:MAG: selenium metabolism-associated LysR family transcriptional regulator [Coriobacteriia bacterium]|nr:selenium metabolism-associated LysR family transcriptional regulator [Coriobacteriia bacterium]MCL2606051.1 selenium metabolism-associated LysR family transcriptional regulator [Coriobacteriia bacterium]
MEFRQIEAFLKVVEAGSFSQAAKELHVSQPSISTYISSLERELGTTLLNRSTKTISVTSAGEQFMRQAKELIVLRSASIDAIKHLSTDLNGEIRIVASSVPATSLLPQALADFHARYPEVRFVVEQADTVAAVQAIADNRADIGFAGSKVKGDYCIFDEFTDDQLIIIAPTTAHTETTSLADMLYSHSFICREQGSGTRIQYEKYLQQQGISLANISVCARMSSTQSIINSVASGLGISIISELAARPAIASGQINVLHTEHLLPQRKIYTVLNKHIAKSYTLNTFLKFLGSN